MENETDRAPGSDAPLQWEDATTPIPADETTPSGREGTQTLKEGESAEQNSLEDDKRDATESLAPTLVTPNPNRDPLIGAHVGNYRIVSVLGGGGFGTVYMAEDTKLNRNVALKFLRNPLESKHRELFEREAKAIAKLSKHRAIVQIYEWSEYQGQSYFALEYVESSADKLLAQHPEGLSVTQAMQIVADVAEGLDYAHEQGILHRDVKPANILIETEDGAAKISDFGLTRFYDSSLASTTGGISGSPPYMSPEQASGGRVDRRSDVFSLGTTLYELLCGQRPFTGATQFEVLDRIRRDKRVPLRKHKPDLPGFLLPACGM